MKILIYEDYGYKDLFPLNMLRSTYDIRCGAGTILQRIEGILKDKYEITLHCRSNLTAYLEEVHKNKINVITKDDYLLLNGKVIFTGDQLKFLLSKKEKNSYFSLNNEIVGAYITKDRIQNVKSEVEKTSDGNIFNEDFFNSFDLKKELMNKINVTVIKYPWDIIKYLLHGGLNEDFEHYLNTNKKFSKVKDKHNFINYKKIFVSGNVKILPEVVLDASQGNIIIEENAMIEPITYIKGPVYIGKNCQIKSGTKIYGPCVIGEYSRVSGEIAESVFHSYVNKQHDGFAGHSYVCPFVNFGAGTVTSDLKNNYSKIRIKASGHEVNTDMQLLGSIVGDHSKTSINTMLNTGTITGIFANLIGGGFHPKEIRSFSWNESGKPPEKYDIEKAIETAGIVMERRGLKLSRAYEELVRSYDV